mgnify:FL=1
MLFKTHVVVAIFVMLLFLPNISREFIFIPTLLISTILPDIDSAFSTLGKSKGFRPLQMFTKHRGFLHSFTFCIIVSLTLTFFFPVLALPFFLGYSVHLSLDSLTIEGIQPFWPNKKTLSWRIRTSGMTETTLFFTFTLADAALIILFFMSQ